MNSLRITSPGGVAFNQQPFGAEYGERLMNNAFLKQILAIALGSALAVLIIPFVQKFKVS